MYDIVQTLSTGGGREVKVALWQRAGSEGQAAPCPVCEQPAVYPVAFQVASIDGRPLCRACVQEHYSEPFAELLAAVDDLDTALFHAEDPQEAAALMRLARHLVDATRDRYLGAPGDQPAPLTP